jgi:DMSO reductase anchor subunit
MGTFVLMPIGAWGQTTPLTGLAEGPAKLPALGLVTGGYYMYRLYRIPARPYWNHWHTGAAFAGTGLALGSPLLAIVSPVMGTLEPALVRLLAGVAAAGLALEAIGLLFHARDLKDKGDEGAASLYEQSTRYGYPYLLRNALLGLSLLTALGAPVYLSRGVGIDEPHQTPFWIKAANTASD